MDLYTEAPGRNDSGGQSRMISFEHTLLVPIKSCPSHAEYHNSNIPQQFIVGAHFREAQGLFSLHLKKKPFA